MVVCDRNQIKEREEIKRQRLCEFQIEYPRKETPMTKMMAEQISLPVIKTCEHENKIL
jgi:hypothetical protein